MKSLLYVAVAPGRRLLIKVTPLNQTNRHFLHLRHDHEVKLHDLFDSHPHIISCISHLKHENYCIKVFDHINGISTLEFTEQVRCPKNKLLLSETIALFLTLATGIVHLHKNGVIHADLSLSNIIIPLSQQGYLQMKQIKIIDFGNAIFTHDQSLASTGTYGVMAPEQIKNQPLSFASDIFSLGVLFYTIISRRMPFGVKGNTVKQITDNTLNYSPAAFTVNALLFPPSLRKLILSMLDKQQEDRPTIYQVCNELKFLLNNEQLFSTQLSKTER